MPWDLGSAILHYGASQVEQMDDILDFFNSSDLEGVGPKNTSAPNKLNALRNMLDNARYLIENDQIWEARAQLADAYQKTDGNPNPPDLVVDPDSTDGDAASDLARMIEDLMKELGCSKAER